MSWGSTWSAVQAYNFLAHIEIRENSFEKAAEFMERSLLLDDKQARVHAGLGQITADFLNRPVKALVHLKKAVELDPGLETKLAPWISALEAGKTD